jgi:putative transposase
MKKRFNEEQIVRVLRRAEAADQTVAAVCKQQGISEQTWYRWKKKFGQMGVTEVRRLRQLEQENGRLKRIVASPWPFLSPFPKASGTRPPFKNEARMSKSKTVHRQTPGFRSFGHLNLRACFGFRYSSFGFGRITASTGGEASRCRRRRCRPGGWRWGPGRGDTPDTR